MSGMVIEDFEEVNNCPVCTGLLRGDTAKGLTIKICSVQRNHGYFVVTEADGTWLVEFNPGSP